MANIVSENDMFYTSFEPRLTNRFVLYMDGIPSYMIKGFEFPRIQQNAKAVDHINLRRFVKGKSVWGPTRMTLYDPVVPSGAQTVMEWIRLHHESLTGRDGYADMYKKEIVIQILGPVGDVIGEWIGKGCMVTDANFGTGDWARDEVQEIAVQIQADWWALNY